MWARGKRHASGKCPRASKMAEPLGQNGGASRPKCGASRIVPPKLMPVECDRVAWSLDAGDAWGLAWLGGRAGFFPAPIFPALIFRGRSLISALQGCGVRGKQCDPGAYKIRTGAVPVQDRGSGHTAPTYIS